MAMKRIHCLLVALIVGFIQTTSGCSNDNASPPTSSPNQSNESGSAGENSSGGFAGASGLAGAAGNGSGNAGAGGGEVVSFCGSPSSSWKRCAMANPLVLAGFLHSDQRLETSTGDPDVMFDVDDNKWKMWWSTGLAKNYLDTDAAMGIKYAESTDGVHWDIQEKPVIEGHQSPDDWDYSKLETPSVVKIASNPPDRRYVMFYSGGNDLVIPPMGYTWYQIGVAFSADGKSFTRLPASESPYANTMVPFKNIAGLVILGRDVFPAALGVADGLVADPEIVVSQGEYHLFFSSLAVDGNATPLAFGVSSARSMDGIHWKFSNTNPIATINGSAHPSVVWNETTNEWEMFFARDSDEDKSQIPSVFNPMFGIFRSTSSDLQTWSPPTSMRDFVWDNTQENEIYGLVAAGDMSMVNGEHRYYYPAWSKNNVPDGFLVPTKTGTLPAVMGINLAIRK
jgi:hypothetical protein